MKVLNKRTEENKVNEGRLLENKKVVHTELERILSYYSLIILTVITKTIIHYGKVCLRHHDLLNYRTDLSKTDIFRKPFASAMIAVFFVFINSFPKKIVLDKITVKVV